MVEVTPKMRADAEALADRICGCANREQHRADVKAILGVMAKHQEAAIRAAIEVCAVTAGGSYHGPDAVERIRDLSVEQIMKGMGE